MQDPSFLSYECKHKAIMRCFSVTIETATNRPITFSECVDVALFIPHAKRMRRIILSSVSPTIIFHIITQKRGFRRKRINSKMSFCFSIQLLSEIFLILRRIIRNTIINLHRSSCKVAVTLVRF